MSWAGRFWKMVASAALGCGLAACSAHMPQKGAALPTGLAIRAPSGFVDFCLRNPADCDGSTAEAAPSTSKLVLTKARWEELNQINTGINRSVRPGTDEANYRRVEYWAYADQGYGDCEDYALTKRRALLKQGWAKDSLALATARNERGELHAVLIVRTDHGDLVLDNATNFIELWNQRPYQWVSLQEPDMPLVWHRAAAATDQTATAALN